MNFSILNKRLKDFKTMVPKLKEFEQKVLKEAKQKEKENG